MSVRSREASMKSEFVCHKTYLVVWDMLYFFFQAEDGIRYLVRSRGLGDVYKRQPLPLPRLQRNKSPQAEDLI